MPTGIADRVKELSTSTGTGTIVLSGTVAGFRSFLTAIGAGNPCGYVIEHGNYWEVGVGLIHAGGFLSRESVTASSDGGALIDFFAGVKRVFIDRTEAFHNAAIFTAGETITARNGVRIEMSSGAGTAGYAYKTDASYYSRSVDCPFVGLAVNSANPNRPVLVRKDGRMTGFTGLTAGTPLYLSTTPGSTTQTAPANARMVALAVSATEVDIYDRWDAPFPTVSTSIANHLATIGPGVYGTGSGGTGNSFTRGTNVDYVDLLSQSSGAAVRGTVPTGVSGYAAVSFDSIAVIAGGAIGNASPIYNDTITIADRYTTIGNFQANGFGIIDPKGGCAGASYSNKGFIAGGKKTGGYSSAIEYVADDAETIDVVGDLLLPRAYLGGAATATIGYFAGGFNAGPQTLVDQIDLTTTMQDATDRGELTVARYGLAGMSADGCLFAGGVAGNLSAQGDIAGFCSQIEMIDPFNHSVLAVDRGELTVARAYLGGVSHGSRGVFCGGQNGIETDLIESIDPSLTTLHVSDRGDLSYARSALAAV